MRNKNAFTLVELLVVISIIALLLSILMPVLANAREQGRIVVCKSNLHQYGLAGAMYLQSNRDAFPHPLVCIYTRASFTTQHIPACRWHDADVEPDGPFWPYLAKKQVHTCPTFAGIAKTRGTKHPFHVTSIPIKPTFTYSMNGFLSAGDQYEDLVKIRGPLQMPRLGNVKYPSRIMFIAEENIWIISKTTNGDALNLSRDALNDMYFYPHKYGLGDCIATFHRASDAKKNTGISNVLFVDGHVEEKKAYRPDDIRIGYSSVSWYLATQGL